MNIDDILAHCRRKKGVTETFPFDDQTLVLKVAGKMFLLASLDSVPLAINLKCAPETGLELRERYDAVQPGYHMNKKHWITVSVDGTVPAAELKAWIDASYELVLGSLPRSDRLKL